MHTDYGKVCQNIGRKNCLFVQIRDLSLLMQMRQKWSFIHDE